MHPPRTLNHMTPSQRPKPIAPVPSHLLRRPPSDADIKQLLADLHKEPGLYASADIHAYYKTICAENNSTPLPANMFGRKLKAWGYRDTRDSTRTVRCWVIPPRNNN